MALGTIFTLAAATTAAALVTGSRVFGFKRMVKHATVTDCLFTGGAALLFVGTLGGTLVAVLAGLMMALFLSACNWVIRAVEGVKTKTNSKVYDDEHDEGGWTYNQAPYV